MRSFEASFLVAFDCILHVYIHDSNDSMDIYR